MSIRYSDYTVEQLRTELGQLVEERQKAEQLGEVNKVAILERKIQIVTSYTLNPDSFHAGDIHQLVGDPGYKFKMLDGLLTNFDSPESTLIMFVSALAGKENIMRSYKHAVEEKYRFFSFGDCMLIK